MVGASIMHLIFASTLLTGICTNVPLFSWGYEYSGITGTVLFFSKDWTLDRRDMRVHRYVMIFIIIVIIEIVVVIQYGVYRSLSIRIDGAPPLTFV